VRDIDTEAEREREKTSQRHGHGGRKQKALVNEEKDTESGGGREGNEER
jgi:hypothetical protein